MKCLESKLFADSQEIETRLAILFGERTIKNYLSEMSVTTSKLHFADVEKSLQMILQSIKAANLMAALDQQNAESEPELEAYTSIQKDKKVREVVALILDYRKADVHFKDYAIVIRSENEDKLVSLGARLRAVLQYSAVTNLVST